jgi:peptidoglycan/xylan/chitin deacetylase (PgdA/CDA1 family)
MRSTFWSRQTTPALVTFYHDVEQNLDSDARPNECRQAVTAFLDLEGRYGVRATYNVAGKLFAEQPDLIEAITRAGHEIAFHSYDHRADRAPQHQVEQIERCRDVSSTVCGYRSARSEIDPAAVARLWEKGFLWNAEGDARPEPYFIHQGLVRLPIAADDWPLHRGDVSVEAFLRRFATLVRQRPYVAVGFHDSTTSCAPQERLRVWETLLQIAARAKAPTVTFSEAADLFRRAALARYYTQVAKVWNRDTQTLYRTRRFQEMLRAEVEKLSAPIIADLGSGGGVLSAPLQDKAKMIYCVDAAPGMVAAAGASSHMQARLGEATESNLPAQSVDLVICARVAEYLFWPERLANEIKRIGKTGATYFITFPTFRGTPPSNDGAPPDRIRRYFTPEEIRLWAEPIGPGRLFGVQYEDPEPSDPETEQRYRRMEQNPPPHRLPTNWVYIGTVAKHEVSATHGRVLPISAARFRFPSERSQHIKAVLRRLWLRLPPTVRNIVRRAMRQRGRALVNRGSQE